MWYNKGTKRKGGVDMKVYKSFKKRRERALYEEGVISEPAWIADERARLNETKYNEACDIIAQLSSLYDDLHAFLNTKYEQHYVLLDSTKEDLMQQKLAIDKLTVDDIEEGDYPA